MHTWRQSGSITTRDHSVEAPDPNVLGPEPIHVAEVIIPRSAIKDLDLLKSSGDSVEEGPQPQYLIVEVETIGGIGSKLEVRDSQFDTQTLEIIELLKKMTQRNMSKMDTFYFHMDLEFDDREMSGWLEAFATFKKFDGPSWPAYYNNSGSLNVQTGQIFSRQRVLEGWNCMVETEGMEVLDWDTADESVHSGQSESSKAGTATVEEAKSKVLKSEDPKSSEPMAEPIKAGTATVEVAK